VLSKDAGDLESTLKLYLQVQDPSAQDFKAESTSRTPIKCRPDGLLTAHTLIVSLLGGPDKDGVDTHFKWKSDATLALDYKGLASLEDWYVYRKDGRADSQMRALWRKRLNRLWVLFYVVAFVLFTSDLWKDFLKKEPVSVEKFIQRIEGDDEQETTRLRAFLNRTFIEHLPLAEALRDVPTLRLKHTLLSKAKERVAAQLKEIGVRADIETWVRG
jgi:hypothetical protein